MKKSKKKKKKPHNFLISYTFSEMICPSILSSLERTSSSEGVNKQPQNLHKKANKKVKKPLYFMCSVWSSPVLGASYLM